MPSRASTPIDPTFADHLQRRYLVDRPTPGIRPWVALNMVSSIDGAIADADGRSGGLSGPADKMVFRLMREWADVILVGAGTVRAENYGPAVLDEAAQKRRLHGGRPPLPRLAVVTASGNLDRTSRLFGALDGDQELDLPPDPTRPMVCTSTERASEVVSLLGARSEVLAIPGDIPSGAIAALHERGFARVLCEGGPTLNAALFATDTIDEVCLTLSPVIVGGAGGRVLGENKARVSAAPMNLCHAESHDEFFLLRYVRRGA